MNSIKAQRIKILARNEQLIKGYQLILDSLYGVNKVLLLVSFDDDYNLVWTVSEIFKDPRMAKNLLFNRNSQQYSNIEDFIKRVLTMYDAGVEKNREQANKTS